VKHVLDQWENHLNITFNCIGSQDATIRIIFDSSNESWSIMGCNVIPVRLPYPTMNLSGINDTEDISDTEKRVILDEFSHAVGLGNEPQSPIGEPTPEGTSSKSQQQSPMTFQHRQLLLKFRPSKMRFVKWGYYHFGTMAQIAADPRRPPSLFLHNGWLCG
jgi:hypothetical protein